MKTDGQCHKSTISWKDKRQKFLKKYRKINKIIYLVIDNFLHSECSILKATLIVLHLIGKQSQKALGISSGHN